MPASTQNHSVTAARWSTRSTWVRKTPLKCANLQHTARPRVTQNTVPYDKQSPTRRGRSEYQERKEKLKNKLFPVTKIKHDAHVYHVEISLYLISLLYCPGCQFTNSFLGSISKATLMKWQRREHKLALIIKLHYCLLQWLIWARYCHCNTHWQWANTAINSINSKAHS